jgi:hypothetical protein
MASFVAEKPGRARDCAATPDLYRRAIHANFSNMELVKIGGNVEALRYNVGCSEVPAVD